MPDEIAQRAPARRYQSQARFEREFAQLVPEIAGQLAAGKRLVETVHDRQHLPALVPQRIEDLRYIRVWIALWVLEVIRVVLVILRQRGRQLPRQTLHKQIVGSGRL